MSEPKTIAQLLGPALTRTDALRSGALIDTTSAAAFVGFIVPCAVSAQAWDEVIGSPGLVATRAETEFAADQLKTLWQTALYQVAQLKARGLAPSSVRLTVKNKAGRNVPLRMRTTQPGGKPAVTIFLEGEGN